MDFSVEQLRADLHGLTPEKHGFTYLDMDRKSSGHGRLSGWVLSAKDLCDVRGMPTTLGNVDRTYHPEHSDAFVEALEEQGALIIGKSSTPEMGLRVDTEPVGLPLSLIHI